MECDVAVGFTLSQTLRATHLAYSCVTYLSCVVGVIAINLLGYVLLGDVVRLLIVICSACIR